jgi:hypothetical protein
MEGAVRARRIGAIATIVLLCATGAASAQSRAPGSVDPPAATAPSSTEITPAEEAKPAKKKARRHRHRAYARPFFLLPPPRYWFQPLPRYHRHRWHRYHRWHHGCRPWFLFGPRC